MIAELIAIILLWGAVILMHKAVAKMLKTMGVSDSAITKMADQYGWISHSTAAYLVAILTRSHPVIQAAIIVALFMYYEIMHYLYPESRDAIIQFASVYTAAVAIQYGIFTTTCMPA